MSEQSITYWHRHPRGFANECTMLYAESEADAEILGRNAYERFDDEREAFAHWVWTCNENRALDGQGEPDLKTRPARLPANWHLNACVPASDEITELWLS